MNCGSFLYLLSRTLNVNEIEYDFYKSKITTEVNKSLERNGLNSLFENESNHWWKMIKGIIIRGDYIVYHSG